MSKPRIAIIVGSVRPNRFADQPTQWIAQIARERGDFDVEVVDLRDYPLPFFAETTSPAYGASKDEAGLRWQKKVAGFDGYIVIAPEYNRAPTAVLKNALDYAYKEWANKPIAFVSYGSVGGARAVEQLRLIAIELQMAPVRHAVHIQPPFFLELMRGEKKLHDFEHLNQSARMTLDQLAWWTHALKAARDKTETRAAA